MNELHKDEYKESAARIQFYAGPVLKALEAPTTGKLLFEVIGPAVDSLFPAGKKLNIPLG